MLDKVKLDNAIKLTLIVLTATIIEQKLLDRKMEIKELKINLIMSVITQYILQIV